MYQRLFLILFIIPAIAIPCYSQAVLRGNSGQNALQRNSPEEEGVASAGIIDFINAAQRSKHEFHSFLFIRHGNVIAEGWWDPYKPSLKHTLYSLTKSFVSTAVGLAIAEGRINLTDKVISFFPDKLPDTVSDHLQQLTIKDLLTMSVGQDPDPSSQVILNKDWVKAALAVPVVHEPGTKFLYNNVGPNLLSAILQKKTGQRLIDYLQPRLFEPLGINGIDWEQDPQGVNTGGWGLRVKTEDIARLGLLYLQKGKWNGQQILPEKWVEEATATHILQKPERSDSSDWEQGYGYFFWQCRPHAFRGDGAFGQYMIVLPEMDAVIVLTGETSDMQGELNLVWQYLLPAMKAGPLTPNPNMDAVLKRKLASLSLPVPRATMASLSQLALNGRSFGLQPNKMQWQNISFSFAGDSCAVSLKADRSDWQLGFASGRWKTGETGKHGPYLLSDASANLTGPEVFKTAGAFRWIDTQTLELTLRYIDTPHTETIVCRFVDDKITIEIHNSMFASQVTTMHGERKR